MAIQRFRHKGLAAFFERGTRAGIRPEHAARLKRILTTLQAACGPQDLALPGFHPLTGDQAGRWAVTVSGNWRVTFAFSDQEVTDVDVEDYH